MKLININGTIFNPWKITHIKDYQLTSTVAYLENYEDYIIFPSMSKEKIMWLINKALEGNKDFNGNVVGRITDHTSSDKIILNRDLPLKIVESKRGHNKRWTDEDDKLLRKYLDSKQSKKNLYQLMIALSKTPEGIYSRVRLLGYKDELKNGNLKAQIKKTSPRFQKLAT